MAGLGRPAWLSTREPVRTALELFSLCNLRKICANFRTKNQRNKNRGKDTLCNDAVPLPRNITLTKRL